ncbi:GNAT family N-acetyltransferase [Sphingoaurantiacus capsulatus]|uniref:GNAT family N-acetyltransferase n=1 Tax=Sphingoaurantiacus capsulatus TaxID=1771310 RepID=A0ABV7XDM8_9SPHN
MDVADEVARAHAEIGRLLTTGPDVWTERQPGVSAHISPLPYAGCNGLYVFGPEATAEMITSLVARVQASGLPFTVKLRSSVTGLDAMLDGLGLHFHEDLPLMAVEPDAFRPVACPPALALRTLTADEPRFHMDLVAHGLGSPRGALDLVMSEANQAKPFWGSYVGEVDGALAVTGSSIAGAEHAGLIAIATDDDFRRRGYAAALTSRMVADAFAGGARRVFLHSSEMGFRLYEALGFRKLEDLRVWVGGPA